jgi:hypothetical protein
MQHCAESFPVEPEDGKRALLLLSTSSTHVPAHVWRSCGPPDVCSYLVRIAGDKNGAAAECAKLLASSAFLAYLSSVTGLDLVRVRAEVCNVSQHQADG